MWLENGFDALLDESLELPQLQRSPSMDEYIWPQDISTSPIASVLHNWSEPMGQARPETIVLQSTENAASTLVNANQPQTYPHPASPETEISIPKIAFKRNTPTIFRPHRCPIPGCKARPFSNQGDLKRHKRSVHGRPQLVCPEFSCPRHLRGFARKDNLNQHLSRCHSQAHKVKAASCSLEGDRETSNEQEDAVTEQMDVVKSDDDDDKNAMLKAKLLELEMKRTEIEGDIEAVKRTLALM